MHLRACMTTPEGVCDLFARMTSEPLEPLGTCQDLLSSLAFCTGRLVLFAVGGGGFLVRAILWVPVGGDHR